MNDYHEICLLSFDNMVTYDLVWFILNTCSDQHIPILIELYEKNLLELTTVEKIEEFEQSQNATLQTVTAKVSFYLMELIFFSVNFKVNFFLFFNDDNASSGNVIVSIARKECDISIVRLL